MDTKDTAERIAPSVAPAKQAPTPKPGGEPEPEVLVPSVPCSGLEDDSLRSLEVAFSGLHVPTPEGKAQEKETGEGGAKDVLEGQQERSEDASSGDRPSESALGATEHPVASSPTTTPIPATHPAVSSPTTTPSLAEGTGFTGRSYPTHGVEPLATEPPMAHLASKPAASGSFHLGIHEPTPSHKPDAFCGAPVGVCPPTIPAYTMPEHGFTSLNGLRGPQSC